MKLSVIVPAYNEEATIAHVIDRVLTVPLEIEIIVVDDASVDRTWDILQQYGNRCTLLRHKVNQGKGKAIRTALPWATGEVVIIQDADLEYDPFDYPRLIQPIVEGRSHVVYGSRLLNGKSPTASPAFYWGGRFLSWLTNVLYGLNLTDEPTCYKVFRTEIIRSLNLTCTGFEFCPEVTALIALQGLSIVEVPISYTPRTRSEGKKVSWYDGWMAIKTLLAYRFAHLGFRNRTVKRSPFAESSISMAPSRSEPIGLNANNSYGPSERKKASTE